MASKGIVDVGVYFLRKEKRHEVERPYAFKFEPADGFHRSNVCNDFMYVRAEDMRGREQDFELEKHGFCVHQIDDPLPYEDYFVPERLETYFREVETTLKHKLQASKVKVFRHCVSWLALQITWLDLDLLMRGTDTEARSIMAVSHRRNIGIRSTHHKCPYW